MKSSTVSTALPGARRSPAAELLEEDCGALRRTQEQHRVDLRDVETLVEQVGREQSGHLTAAQLLDGPCPLVRPGHP
jgi:hypothetical protein